MNIAIPNNGNMVNQHFGMSQSFVIVTVENKEIKNVKEISTVELAHQHDGLAALLVENNVELVIVGGIGAGAVMGLSSHGLKVIKGASGDYKDVVKAYVEGSLVDKNQLCNHHCEH